MTCAHASFLGALRSMAWRGALACGAWAVCPFAVAGAAGTEPVRYTLDAELRATGTSAEGRFALEARARYTPSAASADGRFALKSVNAPEGGCDPIPPDSLLSDDFESP